MFFFVCSQLRKWIASNFKGSARTSKGKTISAHFQNPVQQQSHSKSSVPQTDPKPAAPSAPPLDMISHHYGMGYGNESSEYRMGYGGMGMYNAPYSGTEIQNYQSNYPSPHTPQQPPMTTTSRDDTAPIPYPPQHPHTLHPNHTLPAPLHHITTGHYSHNAVYPSHLTYTNNTPTYHAHQQIQYHQLHHQQHQPSHVPSNHHPHCVQPVAMYPGGNVQPTQQYGMGIGSVQQRGPDSSPAHAAAAAAAGPYHTQQNVTPHPVKPPPTVPVAGHKANRPPPPAFPIAPDFGLGQQSPHRMPAALNQHPQYYQNYYAAAAPVNTAAARQLFPPSTTTAATQYPHYQVHSVQPQTQGQLYGRVGHQQAFQTQDRAGQHVPNQQLSRSRGKEEISSGMARLKLEQGASHYHSTPGDVGKDGYRVVLKPAANMVRFKFNTEAILKASNIKFKT